MSHHPSFTAREQMSALLVLVTLYMLTDPGNRFESIDGYDYARAAETVALRFAHDTRSLLFHKLNRLLYLGSQALGLPFDAHRIIRTVSMLAGAASVVLLARLLTERFAVSRDVGVLAGAILATSYGFWRYAVEVEVYVPSILLILATIALLLQGLDRPEPSARTFLLAGAVGGLGCLYYQANILPLCLAAPVLLIGEKGHRPLVLYAAAGAAVTLAGLVAAFVASEAAVPTPSALIGFLTHRFEEFDRGRSLLYRIVGSAPAIVYDLVSLNWLYGLEWFRSLVLSAMPSHLIRLEGLSHAAMRYKPFIYAAFVLIPMLIALAGLAIVRSWGGRRPAVAGRRMVFLAVWLTANLLVNAWLGGPEPEVWITTLPVIVMLLAVLVLEPASAGRGPGLLWTLPVLMLAHNFLGGLGMFQSPRGLHYERSQWLARELRPADIVLVDGPYGRQSGYLLYRVGARLVYSDGATASVVRLDERFQPQRMPHDELLRTVSAAGGRVFTIGDLSRLDPRVRASMAAIEIANAEALATKLRGRLRLVHEDAVVQIYQITP
jgi:hypothetical protein